MNVWHIPEIVNPSKSAQQALLDSLHAVQGAPSKGVEQRDVAGGQLDAGRIMERSRSERSGQDLSQPLFGSTTGEASKPFHLHTLYTF